MNEQNHSTENYIIPTTVIKDDYAESAESFRSWSYCFRRGQMFYEDANRHL